MNESILTVSHFIRFFSLLLDTFQMFHSLIALVDRWNLSTICILFYVLRYCNFISIVCKMKAKLMHICRVKAVEVTEYIVYWQRITFPTAFSLVCDCFFKLLKVGQCSPAFKWTETDGKYCYRCHEITKIFHRLLILINLSLFMSVENLCQIVRDDK